jgi:hypothetical protein
MQAIRRARRAMLHAAGLLEREAEALRLSHTVRGRWSCFRTDRSTKRDHDDMLATARQLRTMAGEP